MNGESTLVLKEQNHLQAGNRGSAVGPEDWAMFPAGDMPDVRLKGPPASDIPSLGLSLCSTWVGPPALCTLLGRPRCCQWAPYKDIPFPMTGLCTPSELSDLS